MVNGGEKLLFLKNNKYKGLITAVLITIVVALLAFKLIDNIEIFINIIKKFISLSMSFIYGIVIAYVLTPIVKLFEVKAKLKRGVSKTRNAIKLLDHMGYPKEIIKKSYNRAETLEKYM